MNTAAHRWGFIIRGPCTGDRRRVAADVAFLAYCRCAAGADVEHEGYLSAFHFADDFRVHLEQHATTSGFAGSTWSPWVWFDIDRAPDEGGIGTALADTRDLVDVLDESFGVPREVLLPFVSGGKGFHVGLPTALWLPPADTSFHAIARRFAESIATEAKVAIDTGIYDCVRAFRAPNSRHPRTGLHKRYVPVDRLFKATADELLDDARTPAPFDPPSTVDVESVDFLVADWDRATREVAEHVAAAEQRRHAIAEGLVAVTINRATRDLIAGESVPKGSRHTRVFSAAANLAEVGCSHVAVRALVREPALNLGLPPREVDRQIECGIAHALKRGATLPPGGDA